MEKNERDEMKVPEREEAQSAVSTEDEYEGYTRDNPPPWLDEFEYIDFMITH